MGLLEVITRPVGAGLTLGQLGAGALLALLCGAVGGAIHGALIGAGPTSAGRRMGAGAAAGLLTAGLMAGAVLLGPPGRRAEALAAALPFFFGLATLFGVGMALMAPFYARTIRAGLSGWRAGAPGS